MSFRTYLRYRTRSQQRSLRGSNPKSGMPNGLWWKGSLRKHSTRGTFFSRHQTFYKSTANDNREVQRLFRRAIDLDSSLAEAYGFLSYSIVLSMVYFDAEPDDALLNEAVAIAKNGATLDERDALIRFMYGRALLARKSYSEALGELEIAAELDPNLAVVYCGLGDRWLMKGASTKRFLISSGDRPQSSRSLALGILFLQGARTFVCGRVRSRGRMGAQGHPRSELPLLGLCAPGRCVGALATNRSTGDALTSFGGLIQTSPVNSPKGAFFT